MNILKKTTAILLAVLMLAFAVPFAFAAEPNWTLENGVLTISGTGKMPNYVDAPWKRSAREIRSIVIGDGITSIGGKAFIGCANVQSVSLPDTLTSIGDDAFSGCVSLAGISLPDSVKTFGKRAFDGCTSLQAIVFPANAKTLDAQILRGCTALSSVTLPEKIKAINMATFYGCTALASIDIPEGVVSIGANAFQGCTALGQIVLPFTVASIGNAAFYGCTSLTDVTILNPDCSFSGKQIFPETVTIHALGDSNVEAFAANAGLQFEPMTLEIVEPEPEPISRDPATFLMTGFLGKLMNRIKAFYNKFLKLFGIKPEKLYAALDELQNGTPEEEEEETTESTQTAPIRGF